jgi:hypothetical protein
MTLTAVLAIRARDHEGDEGMTDEERRDLVINADGWIGGATIELSSGRARVARAWVLKQGKKPVSWEVDKWCIASGERNTVFGYDAEGNLVGATTDSTMSSLILSPPPTRQWNPRARVFRAISVVSKRAWEVVNQERMSRAAHDLAEAVRRSLGGIEERDRSRAEDNLRRSLADWDKANGEMACVREAWGADKP